MTPRPVTHARYHMPGTTCPVHMPGTQYPAPPPGTQYPPPGTPRPQPCPHWLRSWLHAVHRGRIPCHERFTRLCLVKRVVTRQRLAGHTDQHPVWQTGNFGKTLTKRVFSIWIAWRCLQNWKTRQNSGFHWFSVVLPVLSHARSNPRYTV